MTVSESIQNKRDLEAKAQSHLPKQVADQLNLRWLEIPPSTSPSLFLLGSSRGLAVPSPGAPSVTQEPGSLIPLHLCCPCGLKPLRELWTETRPRPRPHIHGRQAQILRPALPARYPLRAGWEPTPAPSTGDRRSASRWVQGTRP